MATVVVVIVVCAGLTHKHCCVPHGLVLLLLLPVVFACHQLLGLLLPKYVPDESLLRLPSWVGVLQHADALVPMLQQHVMEPLLHGEGERGWGMQTGLRAWCTVLVGTPGWLSSAIFSPGDDGPAEVWRWMRPGE